MKKKRKITGEFMPFYFLSALGFELRTSFGLGKCCTTELYPQPYAFLFYSTSQN
jgi:hypothetical protein